MLKDEIIQAFNIFKRDNLENTNFNIGNTTFCIKSKKSVKNYILRSKYIGRLYFTDEIKINSLVDRLQPIGYIEVLGNKINLTLPRKGRVKNIFTNNGDFVDFDKAILEIEEGVDV